MRASPIVRRMRRTFTALALGTLALSAWPALGADPLTPVSMGHPETDVAPGEPLSTDPKLGDVTIARPKGVVLFDRTALEADLRFWNHRLYEVHLKFPRADFGALSSGFGQTLGRPARDEVSKGDHDLTWYAGDVIVSVTESEQVCRVWMNDRTQQDLRWTDLLTGTGRTVVLTFVGSLVAWFLIVSLIGAWCPKCHSFSMKQGDRVVGTPEDVSGDPTSVNYRSSVTFKYRCAKCGHGKEDRYSAFSQRNRP